MNQFIALFFLSGFLPLANAHTDLLKADSIYQLNSSWTRQDEKEVELKSLQGTYVIVAMLYTSCELACPMIIADLKKMDQIITGKQKSNVRFALFSLDPKNDTALKLREYASAHQLDLSRFSLYRSSEPNVRGLAAVLGMKYRKAGDGTLEHSNLISLLDPDGKIIKQNSGLNQDAHSMIDLIKVKGNES